MRAGFAAVAVAAVAIVAFPRLRPALQAGVAGAFGVLGLVNGAMHVGHLRAGDGVAGGDLTGVAAALAGAVLVALAVAVPVLRRREPRRRAVARAVAVPAVLAGLVFFVVPVSIAIVDTHKWREPIGPAPAGWQDVASADVHGWYHPSRTGAAVLVVHGGGGDREGAFRHAELFAERGYGVLVFDAPGRGESAGEPNGWGWNWRPAVDHALDWLERQPGVDSARVAGLGLSTGADVLFGVAADRDLAAVVADGAAATRWEDARRIDTPPLEAASGWVMLQAVGLFTGDEPPPPLADTVARIREPLLLVSAGTTGERDYNALYGSGPAGGPVEHWNLPGVAHTEGLQDEPDAYARRVLGFVGRAVSASP